MRIAYDHQIFGWQEYGGISRYFYEIGNELAAVPGCEVAAIAPLHVNRYLESRRPGFSVRGRHVPRLPHTGRIYRAINALFVPAMLRSFDPRIVHETYYSRRRLAPAGAVVVVTVFDMIHERFPEDFSRFDPTRADKAAAVARADHVICISENTRRDLVDILEVPAEKTSVVYLGSALTAAPGEADKLPAPPYLLHVGLRRGYKNFAGLLRAYAASARLVGDFRLVCFGGGAFSAEETSLIGTLNLRERVVHVSGDDEKLAACYAGAAAFVYPSRYEGFGIPPLEAMAAGCPVVSSGTSSLPEVVGDAAQLFDPADDDAMREAIEAVVYSPTRRAELIECGHRRAAGFTWSACARNTLDVYRRLAS